MLSILTELKEKWAGKGFDLKWDYFDLNTVFGMAAVKTGVTLDELDESNAMAFRYDMNAWRKPTEKEIMELDAALSDYFDNQGVPNA